MKNYFRPYLHAFKIIWRSSPKWTIIQIILVFTRAVLPLFVLYLLKELYDEIANQILNGSTETGNSLNLLIWLGVIFLARTLSTVLEIHIDEMHNQKISDHLAEVVQNKVLELDLGHFENPEYHDTYFKVQSEAITRPVALVNNVKEAVQNGLSFLLIAGFLSFIHVGIAIVLVISIIPAILIKMYYAKKLYEWQKNRTSSERESKYLYDVLTNYSYLKEIRLFGASKTLKSRFNNIRSSLFSERLSISKLMLRNSLIAKSLEVTVEVLMYVFIIERALNGLVTIGDLIVLLQAFSKGKNDLSKSLQALVSISEHRMFLGYFDDFLNLKPTLKKVKKPTEFPSSISKGVSIKNVSFSYPGQSSKALQQITANLRAGEITAIVGENGSGKSSLVKLICRLYDPLSGSIQIDDLDLKDIKIDSLQNNLSVCFQDFSKFHFSVKENIQLGQEEGKLDSNFETVLKSSGSSPLIDRLDKGIHQQLGKEFENGIELSLGQWQKLAIARAFYKNAQILIMDEPTSAIDPLSEHRIFDSIRDEARKKGKIVIIVTHRLYNLKSVDKIIVMSEGRMVDQGTHSGLINSCNQYREMFEKQWTQRGPSGGSHFS